jgi:hypothetical protein
MKNFAGYKYMDLNLPTVIWLINAYVWIMMVNQIDDNNRFSTLA